MQGCLDLHMQEMILILDFGSQYTQLIARRVREINVYCEIHPYNNPPEITDNILGVILSGSPFSVRDEDAPNPDLTNIKGVVPLLGVCYGAQFLVHSNQGKVLPSKIREYGRANLSELDSTSKLLADISIDSQVWMSHGDTIQELPEGFKKICSTSDVVNAGFEIQNENVYRYIFSK